MESAFDYKTTYEEATAELQRLQNEKATIERRLEELTQRIEALTQTVNAIAPLIGESQLLVPTAFLNAGAEILKEAGITASVRMVLKRFPKAQFSPPAIREYIMKEGWDLEKTYTNALSTIHTVLKRLVESGEVTEALTPDGKKYQWKQK